MTQKINYQDLAQNALRAVLRDVITQVAETGMPGAHHFYITFDTRAENVTISPALKQRYPEYMTIILQHQFENLTAHKTHFSVRLHFESKPEDLHIAYDAITRFYDPSVEFGLEFHHTNIDTQEETPPRDEAHSQANTENIADTENEAINTKPQSAEIVSLDSFRDK